LSARCDDVQVAFVPDDFQPPPELVADQSLLEPLGPEHNEDDHEAWPFERIAYAGPA
jgi:hypothetical protein